MGRDIQIMVCDLQLDGSEFLKNFIRSVVIAGQSDATKEEKMKPKPMSISSIILVVSTQLV